MDEALRKAYPRADAIKKLTALRLKRQGKLTTLIHDCLAPTIA